MCLENASEVHDDDHHDARDDELPYHSEDEAYQPTHRGATGGGKLALRNKEIPNKCPDQRSEDEPEGEEERPDDSPDEAAVEGRLTRAKLLRPKVACHIIHQAAHDGEDIEDNPYPDRVLLLGACVGRAVSRCEDAEMPWVGKYTAYYASKG